MKRLSEFKSTSKVGWGEPIDIIANIQVTVHAAEIIEGAYGPLANMDVELPSGQRIVVRTGAKIILEALERAIALNEFPLLATFVKKGRYWDVQ